MKGESRRQEILKKLSATTLPVTAGALSREFGVSRQIIVKDIARLREMGYAIDAMQKGYQLKENLRVSRVFKTLHTDEEVEKELNCIVDLGGCVEDVFISHKVYHQIKAPMHIRTRNDVENFLIDIATGKSSLLKNVTSGYHYHTVSAESVEILDRIENALWENGFLAPLVEYEPTEIKR